jgi:hypothetical protein
MNIFVIVGSGVEAVWNGLEDRLICQPWISFCGGFVKDNVYVLALPSTLHELKTRIREACANTDQEIV